MSETESAEDREHYQFHKVARVYHCLPLEQRHEFVSALIDRLKPYTFSQNPTREGRLSYTEYYCFLANLCNPEFEESEAIRSLAQGVINRTLQPERDFRLIKGGRYRE